MPEARLVLVEVSANLQELLPTSVTESTAETQQANDELEIEYDISSTIYNIILSDSEDFTLDITLTMENDLVSYNGIETSFKLLKCIFQFYD